MCLLALAHDSDYFDRLLELGTEIIKRGKAYVDATPHEEMKEGRMHGIESAYRNNSIEENLRLWNEMIIGSDEGKKCLLRAKIDMQCPNKCLRDPGLYRVVDDTPHHRTGVKYKAYPLYDFACPIVDSLEGVTHAMRSSEYHDRNPLYYWYRAAAAAAAVAVVAVALQAIADSLLATFYYCYYTGCWMPSACARSTLRTLVA